MSALDALLHLVNFALVPLLFAAVAAGLAKLAWPRRLRGTAWLRLALWSAAGAFSAYVANVLWSSHDGTIVAYLGMVGGGAAGLAWAGRERLLAA